MNKQGWWNSLGIVVISSLILSGCDTKAAVDPSEQIGSNPLLPKAQNFLGSSHLRV